MFIQWPKFRKTIPLARDSWNSSSIEKKGATTKANSERRSKARFSLDGRPFPDQSVTAKRRRIAIDHHRVAAILSFSRAPQSCLYFECAGSIAPNDAVDFIYWRWGWIMFGLRSETRECLTLMHDVGSFVILFFSLPQIGWEKFHAWKLND